MNICGYREPRLSTCTLPVVFHKPWWLTGNYFGYVLSDHRRIDMFREPL